MTRLAALAPAIVALAVAAALVAQPERAAACSIGPGALDEYAEYAIVGEVVSEEPSGPAGYDSYTSTIRVAATLKGDPPRMLVLEGMGQLGAGCEGGPRLQQGERVLLFVGHYRLPQPVGGPSVQPGPLYVPGYENGKYLLADGVARSAYAEPNELPAGDALRRVAAITGASPQQLDAALAFARGDAPTAAPPIEAVPLAEDDDDGSTPGALLIALASIAGVATLLGVAAVAWRLRRS